MSQINLKSILGITSITTPAGVDDVFTVHSNDTTERFRVDKNGNQVVAGILTVTQDLNVDGHTNLDNVSIAGVSTFSDNIRLAAGKVYGFSADTNTYITNYQADSIEMTTGGVERFELKATPDGNSTVLTISDDGNHGSVYGGTGVVVHGSSGARIKFAQNSLGYGIADGFEVGAYDGGAYLINREPQDIFFSIAPNSSSNPSELVRIKSNGRVGINASTPSAQLDVRTDEDPASGLIGFIRNNTANGNGAFYGIDVNNVGNWSFGIPDNTDAFVIVDGEGNSGAEKVRINSSGNLHIGSGDPTIAKLQVSGAGFFGSANTTKTNDGVIIERNSSDGVAHITAGRSGGNYSGMNFYVAGASGVTLRHLIDYQSNFRWYAANGTTERAKITSDGYSKFTSDGTYDGYSNAAQAHEFRQSLNKPTLWCSNSSSAQTWEIIRAESARGNNSAFHFFTCTSGNLTDDEFRVRGDGQVYADGSFNSGGADYAEYFEWTDGNSSYEDRRGMTVVLDGNKVKLSTSSDSTDNIIGVVSGNASVIGDAASEKWTDKYLRDDYGAYLRNENGERVLNPSFDDTKTYVSREDRQEWDAIGMVGKLRIRKGQITGTRWIKMRDISDTVEEWLVR